MHGVTDIQQIPAERPVTQVVRVARFLDVPPCACRAVGSRIPQTNFFVFFIAGSASSLVPYPVGSDTTLYVPVLYVKIYFAV